MNNKEFMTILKKACEFGSVEQMDKYLDDTLNDVFPYNLCFGKRRVIELNIDGECIEVDMKQIEK